VLHARIAQRFEAMLAAGLIDEVRCLRERYTLSAEMPSMRCVGYRQAWEHIEGRIDLDGLRFTGVAATRQLAKRQLTWQRKFREDWPALVELDCLADDLVARVLDRARRFVGA